jgi:hypothetical protein
VASFRAVPTDESSAVFRPTAGRRLDADGHLALATGAEWQTLQKAAVALPRGCAVRRSLGRVAIQRALQLCHILTIEGRGYRWSLPLREAS